MKNILLGLSVIFSLNAAGANYYISASGSDFNDGTSSSSPWQHLSQLNTLSLFPGDTVFLHTGDVFRGIINVHDSGNPSQNIVFTSYGSGAKPVISGAAEVTGWTQNSGIWETSFVGDVLNFFVDDREMTVARYPDEGTYLWLDSATQTTINDADLTQSSAYWDNSKICIHTCQWAWEKSTVQSYIPGKLTFDATQVRAINGYAYFLYNSYNMLNAENEWYYDSSANKIFYIPLTGQEPNSQNCEAANQTAGIRLFPGVSHICITNIAFEKQFEAGVLMSDATVNNITVANCDFYRQYNYGVWVNGKYHNIHHCYFREVDGHAIDINDGGNAEIHHNIFRNIGQFRNSGIGGQTNLSAIAVNFTDSCYIHHNDIDSTGYCGISADGGYHIVERNKVAHAMLLNNDGAPLKSFGAASHHNIFRNNIVHDTEGNTEGTHNGEFATPGIYFDYNVNHCTIQDNTFYNLTNGAIFQNGGTNNNIITGNVVYGSRQLVFMNGSSQPTPIHDDRITHNTFFALQPQALLMKQSDSSGVFNFGIIDSNYCFQPYSGNMAARYIHFGPPANYTFQQWQTQTGSDLHSRNGFVQWNYPDNHSELFINTTDSDTTIYLPSGEYLDLDSNSVCGSISLAPYTSKVLISTGNICAVGVVKITAPEFSVYPNPFSDELIISGFHPNSEIQIFDLVGKEMATVIPNDTHDFRLSTSSWKGGMYFIRQDSFVKKMVKQ